MTPDIDASLDEQGSKTASGTPSRRSAPGGRSCRRTEPAARVAAAAALVALALVACTPPSAATAGAVDERGTSLFIAARPAARRLRVSSGSRCRRATREACRCRRCARRAGAAAHARGRRDALRPREAGGADGARLLVPRRLRGALVGPARRGRSIPWVDTYSVWRGPTEYVVYEQPGLFEELSFGFRVPGEDSFALLGPPDVLFFALFLAAADRFGLRPGWTWIAMAAARGDARPDRGLRRRRPARATGVSLGSCCRTPISSGAGTAVELDTHRCVQGCTMRTWAERTWLSTTS